MYDNIYLIFETYFSYLSGDSYAACFGVYATQLEISPICMGIVVITLFIVWPSDSGRHCD